MIMQDEEFESLDECADCKTAITDSVNAFALAGGGALCFECAIRRGGAYDPETETWVTDP